MKNRAHAQNGKSEGIIMRGINKETIFKQNADKDKFLSILERFAGKLHLEIGAYVLCRNQVRFEVKGENTSDISELVKRICISYVQHYFNRKYKRTGSLFQHRYINFFESENTSVHKQIIRYPLLEGNTVDGEYSSYNDIIRAYSGDEESFVCIEELKKQYSLDEYVKHIHDGDNIALTRLAYTPDDDEVRKYLKMAGGERCFYTLSNADLLRVVKNLRKNCVTFLRIAKLMNVDMHKLSARLA